MRNDLHPRELSAGGRADAGTPALLIVGPSWIGDMVLAQSLAKTLKRRYATSRLTMLAPPWSLDVARRMPEVDETVEAPFPHGRLALTARVRLGRRLRAQRFDRAYVLPRSMKSALVPAVAGARRRTGYRGEMRYGLLNDIRALDRRRLPMTVQRFVALGLPESEPLPDPLPRPRLSADAASARETASRLGVDGDAPVLVLCPGAEYGPAKQWPARHFARLARLAGARGWSVWLLGSAREQVLTREIAAQGGGPVADLAGRTSLAEAIDLMTLASTVVTNDSGLMHVAAASGPRVIALYGSSSAAVTPPLAEDALAVSLDLACSPCFERTCPLGHTDCLVKLVPEQVLEALDGPVSRVSGE